MEKELELKKEILSLHDKLKDEMKGHFDYNLREYLDPNIYSFIAVFEELRKKYEELCCINPLAHNSYKLGIVKEKEVNSLENYKPSKEHCSKEKEKEKVQQLMKDVIDHICLAIPEIYSSK